MKGNLIYSLLCSFSFTLFFWFAVASKAGEDTPVGKYVGIFFLITTFFCFLFTGVLGKRAAHSIEKEEEEFGDEEEKL